MKLYICWTTIQTPRPPRGHPCHNAYKALRDAGYDPEVVKVRGLGIGPRFLHWITDGRKEVEQISGQRMVPVLVTDDGQVINDSQRIVEWAKAHPASAGARNGQPGTQG
jgi:Glutathione S-transferase, N-terminal domain